MGTKKAHFKENLATGASTAIGATSGVGMGAALTTENTSAEEITSENIEVINEESSDTTSSTINDSQLVSDDTIEVIESTQSNISTPISEPEHEPTIEMIDYESTTTIEGIQVDIAVVKIDGQEVGFIDTDMDGRADFIASDLNGNGQIDEGEVAYLADQNIGMQQFQEASDFNPLYAQNDMPDYVNDADVDTYLV